MQQGDKLIKITGNPALAKTALSFGALMQVLKEEGEGLMIHCEPLKEEVSAQQETPTAVEELLAEYEDVFSDPKGLPLQGGMIMLFTCKRGLQFPI